MAAKDVLTFACVLIFATCYVLGFPNSGISECTITLEDKVHFQTNHIRKRPVLMLCASIPCKLAGLSN